MEPATVIIALALSATAAFAEPLPVPKPPQIITCQVSAKFSCGEARLGISIAVALACMHAPLGVGGRITSPESS